VNGVGSAEIITNGLKDKIVDQKIGERTKMIQIIQFNGFENGFEMD